MWNNYFYQIRKKYSMRVSQKEPLVINLDGKNVTKNSELNIIDTYEGGFFNSLEKTVKYFTEKYQCLGIFGADEVSFIFEEPMKLINDTNSDKSTYSTEIISVFSQMFYDYFNHYDSHRKIFWHGKCFSIPTEKVKSYLKYKSKLIQVLATTYFLKKKKIPDAGRIPWEDKKKMWKEYADYKNLQQLKKGILYLKQRGLYANDYQHRTGKF